MGLFWSTAHIPSQSGKTAIVTGGNSGIGYYTCLELARAGADVILVARDPTRGKKAIEYLQGLLPNGHFQLELCDVSNISDVRTFASRFLASNKKLDILINNAGVMMLPTRVLSHEGFESQIATNHLGHFALTGLLIPALKKSPAPRIVNVSSAIAWHPSNTFTKDKIDFVHEGNYDPVTSYAESKFANLLFTNKLAKKFPEIIVTAAHPGVASTNLQVHKYGALKPIMPSAASGALPILRAAVEVGAKSGTYYGPVTGMAGPPTWCFMPPSAKKEDLQDALWTASEVATKIKY